MIECIIKDYIGILVRADFLAILYIKMEVYQEWSQKFSYSQVKTLHFLIELHIHLVDIRQLIQWENYEMSQNTK